LEQARARLMPEQLEKAYAAMLAAEGSDWFWWYGDDFTTENAPEFDALFRRNVEEVYRAIGLPPPERLARPIISPWKDKSQAQAVLVHPRRLIHPVIDGYSRSYYEWAGAGFYRAGTVSGSSMYQGGSAFSQLWYGFSLSEVFLRLDPAEGADLRGELRILLTQAGGPERALTMAVPTDGQPAPVLDDKGAQCGIGYRGAILELSLSVTALGLLPADRCTVLLRLVRDGAEVDRLPRYGELEVTIPDRSFERSHWHV
jgi:hypothetical protein